MTKTNSLADRLTDAESILDSAPLSQLDHAFERLLETETQHEERVRRVAIGAWAAAFVCLLIVTASFLIIKDQSGAVADVNRFTFIVAAGAGVVAVAAGSLAFAAWLFRSRTPSLRAIDRRLARLEALLTDR